MSYKMEVWGQIAWIFNGAGPIAELDFNRPRLSLTTYDGCELTAFTDLSGLARLAKELGEHQKPLQRRLQKDQKGRRKRDKQTKYKFGKCCIICESNANAGDVLRDLAELYNRLESFIALAEVMCSRAESRSLKHNVTVKFFGCERTLRDGTPIDEYLAGRTVAASKINPKAAEVMTHYAQSLDVYGVYGQLPDACFAVGKECFVRNPGDDDWVWSGDLPEGIHNALKAREDKARAEDEVDLGSLGS
jgi:hypothetical protein